MSPSRPGSLAVQRSLREGHERRNECARHSNITSNPTRTSGDSRVRAFAALLEQPLKTMEPMMSAHRVRLVSPSLRLLVILATIPAVSCDRQESASPTGDFSTTMDTVGGVVHVANTGTPAAWRLTRVVSIGPKSVMEQETPDEFGRVSAVGWTGSPAQLRFCPVGANEVFRLRSVRTWSRFGWATTAAVIRGTPCLAYRFRQACRGQSSPFSVSGKKEESASTPTRWGRSWYSIPLPVASCTPPGDTLTGSPYTGAAAIYPACHRTGTADRADLGRGMGCRKC